MRESTVQAPKPRVFRVELEQANSISQKAFHFFRTAGRPSNQLPTPSSSSLTPFFSIPSLAQMRESARQDPRSAQLMREYLSDSAFIKGESGKKTTNLKRVGARRGKKQSVGDEKYSLLQLSARVKSCIMRGEISTLHTIEQQMCSFYIRESTSKEQAIVRLRRRICEIVRVFEALELVSLSNRCILITEQANQKGRAENHVSRVLKAKKEQKSMMEKKLIARIKQRDQLRELLQLTQMLQARNQQRQELKKIKFKSGKSKQRRRENEDSLEERYAMPIIIFTCRSTAVFPLEQPYPQYQADPIRNRIEVTGWGKAFESAALLRFILRGERLTA